MASRQEILREYSRQFLLSLGQPDLHLYDPACSNGVFLQAMKVALPRCRTIGQDLSPNMVAYAARRLDEVHCGDCRIPAVGQASVDVVFCRCVMGAVGEGGVMGGGADWRGGRGSATWRAM